MRSGDMRFSRAADEQAFVASRRHYSLHLLVIWCAVVTIGFGTPVASKYFNGTWPTEAPDSYIFVGIAGLTVLTCLVGFCGWIMTQSHRLHWISHEHLWLVVQLVTVSVIMVVKRYNHQQSRGLTPGRFGASDEMMKEWQNVNTIFLLVFAPARHPYVCAAMFGGVFPPYAFTLVMFGSRNAWTDMCFRLLMWLATISIASLGVWWREESERRVWRQAHDLADTEALAAGMTAMAERLCNFVVHLRSDLHVSKHHVIHESFFGKALLDTSFLDVVSSQDQERFGRMIATAAAIGIPQFLPITLLGRGGAVEADVLVVATGQKRRFLVGIRSDAPLHAFKAGSSDIAVMTSTGTGQMPSILGRQTRSEQTQDGIPSEASAFEVLGAAHTSMHSSEVFERASLAEIVKMGMREHWLVPDHLLQVGKPTRVLGRGGFGVVLAAQLCGRSVAVKIPRTQRKGDSLVILSNELRVLRYVRHACIVQFYGAVVDVEQDHVALVYEYVHGMTLADRIAKTTPTALDCFCLTIDICEALQYLHTHNPIIIHGDVTSSNVMVEQVYERPRAKLIDFGLSCMLTRRVRRLGGTRAWAPPEAFAPGITKPAPSADVFSFGWLIHFTATGNKPHGNLTGEALLQALKEMLHSGAVAPLHWPESAPFAERGRPLCMACLRIQPQERPSIKEVKTQFQHVGEQLKWKLGFDYCCSALPAQSWHHSCDEVMSGRLGEFDFSSGSCSLLFSCDVYADEDFEVCGFVRDRIGGARSVCAFGADEHLDRWFAEPDAVRLAVISIVNDIYKGSAFAPAFVDFGTVSLSAMGSSVAVANSTASGSTSEVRLVVSFPAVTQQRREAYVPKVLFFRVQSVGSNPEIELVPTMYLGSPESEDNGLGEAKLATQVVSL